MCTMTSTAKFHHNLTESYTGECNYTWILHNFSCIKSLQEPVDSPTFSNTVSNMKDVKWQLRLFPDGNKKRYKGFVSVFLQCLSVLSNDLEIPLDWEIKALSSIQTYQEKKLHDVFNKKDSDWGFGRFINRGILLNDLKKGNDTLTIVCKISFNKPKSSHLQLSKDVGLLLEVKNHCDVLLIANDGIKHQAHKAILSCRSKVFSAMFEHDMKEKLESVVKIEDVDSDTLKEMLQFMYTGEIKNLQTNFKNLFIVADKYELDDLKEICIDRLNESVNIDNILDLFEFAQTHNICKQKLKLGKYFLENKEQIMSTKGFQYIRNLSRNIVDDLLYISATNDTSVLSKTY